MRFLIVKLSSLGDVVHALPVVADIRAADPQAVVDWVVEPAFAPLLRRVPGIGEVIELPLRRWAKSGWLRAGGLAEARAFLRRLRRERYDAVIDLQGLSKSAIVARLARGPSFGLANRTEGASHEAPARWLVTHAIRVEPRSHALDRSRELVARVLRRLPGMAGAAHAADAASPPSFGLRTARAAGTRDSNRVVFVHGTSRADKLWPEAHWIELGRRIVAAGGTVALPQSGAEEQARAARIAAALGDAAEVWPAMDLDALIERMAATYGAIGVDSGPSHIAVALDLPHVQIYNHPTSWRTGPQARHGHRHQVSVEDAPTPTVDAVWSAWQEVGAARARGEGLPQRRGVVVESSAVNDAASLPESLP